MALAIYWVTIFVGTHLPASIRLTPDVSDKLKHFVAFAGLTFLMCYATTSRRTLARFGTIAAVVLIYAAVDEWSQRFVPRRVPSVGDFLADAAGMLTVMLPYIAMHRWWMRRRQAAESNGKPTAEAGAGPPHAINDEPTGRSDRRLDSRCRLDLAGKGPPVRFIGLGSDRVGPDAKISVCSAPAGPGLD